MTNSVVSSMLVEYFGVKEPTERLVLTTTNLLLDSLDAVSAVDEINDINTLNHIRHVDTYERDLILDRASLLMTELLYPSNGNSLSYKQDFLTLVDKFVIKNQ